MRPLGALTNIPQFFEHLKENIEALKLSPLNQEIGEDADEEDDDDNNEDALEDRPPKKDITKPAARRMKTELLVDENLGHSSDDKGKSGNPRLCQVVLST